MLHIKFQASGPRGSEDENFLIFFYVFLWFERRTSWPRAILVPGLLVKTNLVKDHKTMPHTKFKASESSGSEVEDFFIFFHVFLWFETRTP